MGTATADSGTDCYTLTTNVTGSAGAIWEQNTIDLNQSHSWDLSMFLGCNDGNGADGMVFILSNQKNIVGPTGGALGYAGISPSLVIEFDTWRNNDRADPTYDHLGLMPNGNGNHNNDYVGPIQISESSGNVEDCTDHEVSIKWIAPDKKIEVYWDCFLRFSYELDITQEIFNGNPNVYWGFIATTGGATNIQSLCFVEPSPDIVLDLSDEAICIGESVQLNAQSGFSSYSWTPVTGLSDPTIPNPIANPSQTTLYTLLVTDDCGNNQIDSLLVEVTNPPIPNTNEVNIETCPDQTIVLVGPVGYLNYQWTPDTYLNANNIPVVQCTPQEDISYILSFEDECGQAYTMPFNVEVTSVVLDLPSLEDYDICDESVLSLQAPPGFINYQWTNSINTDILIGQTIVVSPDESINYYLSFMDFCGYVYQDSSQIQVSNSATIDDLLIDILSCEGQNINLSADPDLNEYQWFDESGNLLSTDLTIDLTSYPSGQYFYTAVDACGNELSDSMQLNYLVTPDLLLTQDDAIICTGAELIISTDNQFVSFEWIAGENISQNAPYQFTLSPDNSEEYIIAYTDQCGQISTDTFWVEVSDSPTLDLLQEDITNCQGELITIQTDQDFPDLNWIEGEGINANPDGSFSILAENDDFFILSYTDACGFVSNDSFSLTVIPPTELSIFQEDTDICPGEILTISPDNSFANVQWSPDIAVTAQGNGDLNIIPDNNTLYILNYTDACGFSQQDSFNVNVLETAVLTQFQDDQLICPGDSVPIYLEENFEDINWDPSPNLQFSDSGLLLMYPDEGGEYIISYTDICDNVASDTFLIELQNTELLDEFVEDLIICQDESVIVTLDEDFTEISWNQDFDGIDLGNYSYQLSPAQNTSYTVTYTDQCQNIQLDSFQIEITGPVELSTFQDDQLICPGESIELNLASGFSTISWSPVQNAFLSSSTILQVDTDEDLSLQIIYTDACGFESTDNLQVSVTVPPQLNILQTDTEICPGDSILVQADTNFDQWTIYPNQNSIQNPDGSILLFPDQSTDYEISYSGICNTSVQDDFTIEVQQIPVLDLLQPDQLICGGESVLINFDPDFTTVSCSPSNLFTSTGPLQGIVSPDQSTNFILTYTDLCAVVQTDSFTIELIPAQEIDAYLEDLVLCQNGEAQLNASGGFDAYTWTPETGLSNPNIANPIASPGESILYTVSMEDICGNIQTDEVWLEYDPDTDILDLGDDLLICDAEEAILESPLNAVSYLWSDGSTGQDLTVLEEGSYGLTVSLGNLCEYWDEVFIEFDSRPEPPELEADPVYCEGENLMLGVDYSPGYNYFWSHGPEINSIEVSESGSYQLIIQNRCGISTGVAYIEFEACNSYYIPNIFSPNGDGINDRFSFISDHIQEIDLFEIFDRWGNKVFVADVFNRDTGQELPFWDGTMNGQKCQQDTYVWQARFRMENGDVYLEYGSINLVR